MINLIPKLISERGYTLSDFQRLMDESPETSLSYQSLHRVANKDQYLLPTATKIETLQKIATALNLQVDDLYTMEDA